MNLSWGKTRRSIARTLVAVIAFTLIETLIAPSSFLASSQAANVTTGACTIDTSNLTTANIIDNTTTDGSCLIRFTSVGTNSFIVPSGVNSVSGVVVAGGGGGGFGNNGGGGGAGAAMISNSGISVTSGSTISATVGDGGSSGYITSSSWARGGKGSDSSVTIDGNTFIATGGGGGGGNTDGNGMTGGSGGGAALSGGGGAGGASTINYVIWTEYVNAGSATFSGGGGGGGGAGAAATNSNGAIGVQLFGYNVAGGGSGWSGGVSTNAAPYGGGAPRGTGSYPCTNNTCNGVANTGGGGGGGGAGGSGVVMIKFLPASAQGTIAQSNGFQINRKTTFTFTRTGAVPASTTATYQWQVKTSGSSIWSNVSSGTGGTTLSYQTANLTLADNGNTYRMAVTDSQAVLGISTTTYTEVAQQTLFTPPGGETDSAMSFDGTSQMVYTATPNQYGATTDITLEAWVRPTANNASNWNLVICKEGIYEIGFTTPGSVAYWSYGLSSTTTMYAGVVSDVPVVFNEWHHIALTRASGSANALLYVDGKLAYTGSADRLSSSANSLDTSNTHPFAIGGRRSNLGSNAGFFTGQIDHAAVFSTARTQSQIASDMNSYISTSETGLLGYFDFNEGTGSTVYNRVPGVLATSDLTLLNSPTFGDVKTVDTTTLPAYTIVKFPRSYITANGGWKVPANVTKVSAVVIAGGGGGGSRAAGGGGAGGYVYRNVLSVTPNSFETITVGMGGAGALSRAAMSTHQGTNGQNSVMGNHTIANGGGGGGGAGEAGNTYRAGLDGGSGGGASGDSAGGGSSAAYGLATQTAYGSGNRGGSAMSGTYWNGGGGGGSGGVGSNASTTSWVAGNGGAGTLDPVGGTGLCLAAGGGGGTVDTGSLAGTGGTCSSGVVTAGAGTKGSVVAGSGLANSGSGGGGSGYSGAADVAGGAGGSGVIMIRWITAAKPSYTAPTNAYLNVGMTETFTTNVAVDSATVNLTRTFRWESTTGGAGGTYSLIKQGTGAANAYISWVPTDTSTSGANYLYRVIITDSDTAGLFIVDTSTAVYAVINRALVVSGTSGIAKTINVARSETFTISLGTSTYRTTMTSNNPGITLDTTTATSPIVKISDTMSVGTYYETLTVTDSVSASVVTPMIIKVSPPPSFSFTTPVSETGTVLYYDAGNSFSYAGSGSTWFDMSGRKLNTSFASAPWALSGSTTATCVAPTYSTDYQGILTFDGATKCGYVENLGSQANFSVEFWLRTNGNQADAASIITTPFSGTSKINYACYFVNATTTITCGMWNAGWSGQITSSITDGAWTHVIYSFDNSSTTATLFVNGISVGTASGAASPGVSAGFDGLLIGRRWDSAKYFKGDIASIRIYNRALSSSEVNSNFRYSKTRFDSSNQLQLTPTQKYGVLLSDTFSVTSGNLSNTITLANGNRTGISWNTSSVPGQISVRAGESLTVGTYWETVTVTDTVGGSSYLPVKFTISKADTLTISMDTATTVVYSGSPITVYPKIYYKGLAGVDTLTASTRFTSSTYTDSATVPTDADTYTVIAANPVFSIGSLSNYVNVVYETSTSLVTQANQAKLSINLYGAVAGSPFLIQTFGGSGPGVITETVTAGGTGSNCTLSNHVLSNSNPSSQQVSCAITVTKAASKNYKVESLTATIYFMLFINNQPTNQSGSGSGIGLNGANSVWVDPGATPTIAGPGAGSYAALSTITITGSGFSLGPITVKFNRNQLGTGISVASDTSLMVTIPSGATSGTFSITNANGTAVSPFSITITAALPTI